MKLLHTSDWHVGKTIRGHSRADEHRAVLAEITETAAEHSVDLVIVAGDLFETSSPTPEAESIVYETFLALSKIAPVVSIAGNHDNPRRLQAVAPLLELGNVTMLSEPRSPDAGGVIDIEIGTDGGGSTPQTARLALLPFVSQRSIVRADELMSGAGFENAQRYAERLYRVVQALTSTFSADVVNVLVGHAFVYGGLAGGGERGAHLVEEYAVPSSAFPASANYVALGHLHRPQVVPGATAIHYCGSPLQLDFGEESQPKQVNVVRLEPGLPAKVQAIPLRCGKELRTLSGTLAEVLALAGTPVVTDTGRGLPWLRVKLDEPSRVGIADEVREALGEGVVDVVLEHTRDAIAPRVRRDGRSPQQLFADYLAESDVVDPRLQSEFDLLLEDALLAQDSGGQR